MSSMWPHRLKVWDPENQPSVPQSQDPDTGFMPASIVVVADYVYEGVCDAQDYAVVLARDETGQPAIMADAEVFLRNESKLPLIRPGMLAEVDWRDGTTDDGEVIKVSRISGSIFLKRLDNA